MAASIHNNWKNPRYSETYSEPSKTSNIEPFPNLVECIQPLTIFAKHSILGALKGRYVSGKSKEKFGGFLIISQKVRTAISADFFHF